MSMENAILAHAAALTELAAAIRSMGTTVALSTGTLGGVTRVQGDLEVTGDVHIGVDDTRPASTVRGNTKAEDAADKSAGTKKRPDNKDAELEKAVEKVEADAAGKGDDTAQNAAEVDKQNAPAELSYEKDIRPVLLQVVKGGKRGDVEAFLAEAGVKKADLLPAEKLPALLALGNKLAAEIAAAKAA